MTWLGTPRRKKKKPLRSAISEVLVGVSGLEPEASWSRTKRDTKLRHTPITDLACLNIIWRYAGFVK